MIKSLARRTPIPSFDKYALYTRAVQAPEEDAAFFEEVYRELNGGSPKILREDFCGTFNICCSWVKRSPAHIAYGIDLDEAPVAYGRRTGLLRLRPHEKRRIHLALKNVLDKDVPRADVIAAQNFSYFIFKEREELRRYFANCRATLKPGGIFLCDIFGGSQCQAANVEKTDHGDFVYYWDQVDFDPITHHSRFAIHLRPKGGKMVRDCFTYDWRMWTIPEVRELMAEAGFGRSHIYWEGSAGDAGNGIFTRVETGEECDCWIAYVVGEK